MYARPNPFLHTLAYYPILAIDQIPEIHRVRGIKAGFRHLMGLEQKMAGDIGALGPAGFKDERCHMIAGQTQEEIGVDQLALVPALLVCIETRKSAPHGGPALGERVGSLK